MVPEYTNDEALSEKTKDKLFSPLTVGKEVTEISREKKKYFIGGYSLAGLFALWAAYQTDLFMSELLREKYLKADLAVTDIRRRFGYNAILRGLMYYDKELSGLDAKADDHMIHPVAYFQNGNKVLGENE